ncbi:MAG: OmpH family outer membrane protein [Desulfobacteraceae bacterium]|nr:MAG: OmpH family outer membrane protein [Desulfobacteraceae bacterium]
MMHLRKIFVVFAGCLLLNYTGIAEAADVAKIGVIDFQKILEASSAGKNAQAEINKKGKQMEEELKKRGNELEEIKKTVEREALVMSQEMREQKEREFRIKLGDFESLKKKYMQEFKGFENRLVKRIRDEVVELIQEMGKSGGYLLILEKRTGEIVYSPASVEMTDQFIQKYNTDIAKKLKQN